MTVYADVLFLTNFLFDAGILIILLRLSSRKIPVLRLLLSACMGGVQSLFAFVPYFRILCMPPARFAAAFIMAFIVLYPCRPAETVRGGIALLASAFILSGAISFFNMKSYVCILLLVPIYFVIDFVKKSASATYKAATLTYRGKSVTLNGFYDSGNMMNYNGAPVMLAGDAVFKQLLGNGFCISAAQEWADMKDIRVIPYTALGKTGTAMGIKLDNAIVGGKSYDNAVLAYFDDNFKDDLILNRIMI